MKNSLKYMVIVDWTIEQITIGAVTPGKKFFSENMLGEIFGVSRQTVRRALDELEQQGLITRQKGSGTYISDQLPRIVSQPITRGTLNKTIGVMTTHLDSYIFPTIIQGIESVLTEGGFAVQLTSTKNLVEGEIRALQIIMESRLDGLIVEPTKSGLPSINLQLYQDLIDQGIPIVFIDSHYPELSSPYVALDDEAAGYMTTKHLIDMGHREIVGIFSHSDRQGLLRYKGYAKALIESGIPLRDDQIHWYSKENMLQILYSQELWECLMSCTAAMCYNDRLALMLMSLLRQKGRRVPEDFSLIGIDNTEMAESQQLTTVAHPGSQLGAAAATLLLSMIHGEDGKTHLIPPQLIQRYSVKKLEA